MRSKENEDYEKPTINKQSIGLMNKFGGAGNTLPYDNIFGVSASELVEHFGSPLWVVSEANLREKYKDLSLIHI